MTKLFWLSPSLALTACAATAPAVTAPKPAAAASAVGAATCGAANYGYLVGRPMTDAREIADRDYRLAAGPVAAARANRVTLIYNPVSQLITEIRCG